MKLKAHRVNILNIKYLNIKEMDSITYELLKSEASKERREKASGYVHIEDAYRCICAELLLRVCYEEFTREGLVPKILYERYGKPYLENTDCFHFNISHSGEWVVIAYGDKKVGIDVEKVSDEMEEIAPVFLTKEEFRKIENLEAVRKNARLTKLWTLKESYLKYRGTGLYTAMKAFGVMEDLEQSQEPGVVFHTEKLPGNYYLSVCSEDEHIDMQEVRLKDLTGSILRKRGA